MKRSFPENEKVLQFVLAQFSRFMLTQIQYPRSVGLVGYFEAVQHRLREQILVDVMYHESSDSDLCKMTRKSMIKILLTLKLKEDFFELFEVIKKTHAMTGGDFRWLPGFEPEEDTDYVEEK